MMHDDSWAGIQSTAEHLQLLFAYFRGSFMLQIYSKGFLDPVFQSW